MPGAPNSAPATRKQPRPSGVQARAPAMSCVRVVWDCEGSWLCAELCEVSCVRCVRGGAKEEEEEEEKGRMQA